MSIKGSSFHDFLATRSTEGFEPGQVWRTKAQELWCVTDIDKVAGKVSFLILWSPQASVIGKHSWSFPTVTSITHWQRVS